MTRVNAIREMLQVITKRRLLSLVAARPADYTIVESWLLDIQLNVIPIAMFSRGPLYELWLTIEETPAIQEFLYGLCLEFRLRAFKTPDDWEMFIDTLVDSITQFKHPDSLMSEEALRVFESRDTTKDLILSNPWAIPLILFEQHSPEELGLTIASANLNIGGENRE